MLQAQQLQLGVCFQRCIDSMTQFELAGGSNYVKTLISTRADRADAASRQDVLAAL